MVAQAAGAAKLGDERRVSYTDGMINPHPTTLHLVRHGEVENPAGIFYGRLPRYALAAEGRAQTAATAALLAHEPLAAIYSSPMLRARQTARAIAREHQGQRVQVSSLLNEVKVPLEGRPLEEGIAANWDLYTGNRPPFEVPPLILARMLRFVLMCLKRHAGQTVVGVTHGDPIAFSMLWAWGLPVTTELKTPMYYDYLEPASITTFEFAGDLTGMPAVRYTRWSDRELSRVEAGPQAEARRLRSSVAR